MYQFYIKVSKTKENIGIIFISPVMLTSNFGVALNKRNIDQGSLFCVWMFPCNEPMPLLLSICYVTCLNQMSLHV